MKHELNITTNNSEKRKSNFDENLAEQVNREYALKKKREELEQKKKGKETSEVPEVEQVVVPAVQPVVQTSQDFWTVENVFYRGQNHKVDLLKTLLDNGNSKTQDGWIEYSKQAKQDNGFYTGDMPIYHSLFTSLFKLKDKPEIEEIRSFLEKSIREKWPTTLTRIKYKSSGKDEIVHNIGMDDEYFIKDNFVGKDEYVKDSTNKTNYKTLLGSDNLAEINDIYNWITKKDVYLWRVNEKPSSLDERVAGFYSYSDRASLDCYSYLTSQNPCFGVRVAAKGGS